MRDATQTLRGRRAAEAITDLAEFDATTDAYKGQLDCLKNLNVRFGGEYPEKIEEYRSCRAMSYQYHCDKRY
jgi:hypothetical protein